MDENKNVSAEELAAEQAALQEGKQEDIRANIIAEFGFDETADAERIEKLVNKELENSKKLSSAIGQKIKWRTEATKPKDAITPKPDDKVDPVDIDKKLDKKLDERLAKRDLDEMDVSDALRKEIKDWATFKGISVKHAARAPHIASQIADYEKEQKADEATISRTNKSGGKKTYSIDNPPDVDMSTEAGRKEWAEWKASAK